MADQMAGRVGQMDFTSLAALREQMMASRGQGRGPSGRGRGGSKGGRGRGGSKGSKGKGGKRVAETLEVCLYEVDSLCEVDGRGLLDALTALEAAKETAIAAKQEMTKEEWLAVREDMKPEMPEEVKANLQEAMTCIKTLATDPEGHGLSEDNACLVHLAAAKEGRQGGWPGRGRPGRGGGRGKGKVGEKVEAILTACAAEVDFDCELDVEASDLLASVQERREAKEALMAGKDDMSEEELAAAKAELQAEGEEVKAAGSGSGKEVGAVVAATRQRR